MDGFQTPTSRNACNPRSVDPNLNPRLIQGEMSSKHENVWGLDRQFIFASAAVSPVGSKLKPVSASHSKAKLAAKSSVIPDRDRAATVALPSKRRPYQMPTLGATFSRSTNPGQLASNLRDAMYTIPRLAREIRSRPDRTFAMLDYDACIAKLDMRAKMQENTWMLPQLLSVLQKDRCPKSQARRAKRGSLKRRKEAKPTKVSCEVLIDVGLLCKSSSSTLGVLRGRTAKSFVVADSVENAIIPIGIGVSGAKEQYVFSVTGGRCDPRGLVIARYGTPVNPQARRRPLLGIMLAVFGGDTAFVDSVATRAVLRMVPAGREWDSGVAWSGPFEIVHVSSTNTELGQPDDDTGDASLSEADCRVLFLIWQLTDRLRKSANEPLCMDEFFELARAGAFCEAQWRRILVPTDSAATRQPSLSSSDVVTSHETDMSSRDEFTPYACLAVRDLSRVQASLEKGMYQIPVMVLSLSSLLRQTLQSESKEKPRPKTLRLQQVTAELQSLFASSPDNEPLFCTYAIAQNTAPYGIDLASGSTRFVLIMEAIASTQARLADCLRLETLVGAANCPTAGLTNPTADMCYFNSAVQIMRAAVFDYVSPAVRTHRLQQWNEALRNASQQDWFQPRLLDADADSSQRALIAVIVSFCRLASLMMEMTCGPSSELSSREVRDTFWVSLSLFNGGSPRDGLFEPGGSHPHCCVVREGSLECSSSSTQCLLHMSLSHFAAIRLFRRPTTPLLLFFWNSRQRAGGRPIWHA